MRRILPIFALALSLSGPSSGSEWHMPTPYPDSEHHTRNIRQFAADVESATGGSLTITVHSAGALFKHPEIHRAVRSGQVPIGEMLMGLLGNDDPLFKLDNIPFVATDFEAARALWNASRPEVERALGQRGLVLLYAVPWPPQGLFTKRPVDTAADLSGIRLRAYSPLTSRLAELLGAIPVNIQAPEIPQAFSTGIIDAMFTSASTGVSSQAWDYVDLYTDIRAWIPKNMVVVNQRAFRRLSEQQQQALRNLATQAESRGWEMAAEETREKTRALEQNGIEVRQPGEKLQRELRETGKRMVAEWLQETGPRGRQVLQAYESARE